MNNGSRSFEIMKLFALNPIARERNSNEPAQTVKGRRRSHSCPFRWTDWACRSSCAFRRVCEVRFLAGAYKSASGEETLVRGIWKPVSGNVRERAVTSTDDGRTWKPWFDLLFRPRVSSSDGDDGKIIARLDRQYQAAVQQNDAATMGRILADDFVLVTGSGKTHTRAELLAEARSGQMVYEHQEDAEQTARVWGDTAVVTAKLWEKGTKKGKPFDYTLWFSDTYVRTSTGWRYVFGQASLPLPNRKK